MHAPVRPASGQADAEWLAQLRHPFSPRHRLLRLVGIVMLVSVGVLVPGAIPGGVPRAVADDPGIPVPSTGTWFGTTTGMGDGEVFVDPVTELTTHQDY